MDGKDFSISNDTPYSLVIEHPNHCSCHAESKLYIK